MPVNLDAAIQRLLSLPPSKRAVLPYSFAYTYWNFLSDGGITFNSGATYTFYTDAGVPSTQTNLYGNIWANNGLNLGKAAWNSVLTTLGSCGGAIDWLFADVESGGIFSSFNVNPIRGLSFSIANNANYTQPWNGITAFFTQMTLENASITRISGPPLGDYVVWNKTYNTFTTKLLNEVLYKPTVAKYPSVNASNYNTFNSGTSADSPRDTNGHLNYQTDIFGSANGPVLYGEIQQIATAWSIDPNNTTRLIFGSTTNPNYMVSRSPWNSLLIDLQQVRSIKRNSPNTPLMPWIASIKYTGGGYDPNSPTLCPVGYADVRAGYNSDIGQTFTAAGNSAYYYEMVRHTCLHGTKGFGYWNTPAALSVRGYTGEAKLLNDVLTEVNSKISGFTLTTGDSSAISWLTKSLVSGAPSANDNSWWWRATIKPGTIAEYLSTPNILLNGTTIGTWIETSGQTAPEIKPFALNELFYVQTAYSGESSTISNGSEKSKFLGNNNETISTFQGTAYIDFNAATLSPLGRAYNFEFNPVNPTQSSPWHNVLYELAIDPYKWGARSFMLYWPQGGLGFYNYPFRYLELLDSGYYSSTTDPAYSPARIKGFTSAVKSLLEGRLDPAINGKAGFTAINQPCNVMIYYVCTNGFVDYRWGKVAAHPTGSTYYPGSMAFWDKCYAQTGNTNSANDLFYSYLDRFVNDVVSMKGGATAGTLSVVFDSMVNSATPGTIGLFSTLSSPYTRGLSYEMADWYIASKLKQNGIPVYVEARPFNEFGLTYAGSLTGGNPANIPGLCGATALSDWRNHLSVEYSLWFQNPDVNKDTPIISKFIKDSDTTTIFRWVQNTGPLGTTYDPYKVPLTVSTGGTAFTMTYANGLTGWLYTPQQALFDLYTLTDVYRQFNNSANTGLTFWGTAYKYATRGIILDYEYYSSGSCGNVAVFSTNNAQSITGYYRLNSDVAFEGNRVGYSKERPFNRAAFVADSLGYNTRYNASPTGTAGYWTLDGITFWRQNIKQPSITGFIQMLGKVSTGGIPVGGYSAGWRGATYPYDFYSNGVIPRSMRP